jgi:antitoxin MazE
VKTSIQNVGGGLSVSLPSAVVEEGKLKAGSELEVFIRDGSIVLSPVSKPRSRLDELVSRITDENMHELVDWGPPVGGEVW